MDKEKTISDRALRSNHPRKKLRNRSTTPKSNPETSVTAPNKVSPSPKKKCQVKEKPANDEVQLKAQNHIFKIPSPRAPTGPHRPNQNRRKPMPSKCDHCCCAKEKDESELIYVFPTKSGNKKFCSVPCLGSFRTSWNNFQSDKVHLLEQSMIKDKERANMKMTKLEKEISSLKLGHSNDKTTSLDENVHEMREGDNLDSSAQSEKTDNLINQLHGEIASLRVELSNCETNQEEAIEKLEEKVATLNRQLLEERKNSKTLQENFEAEKAKSESLAINLELKSCKTNQEEATEKLVEKLATLNRQLEDERKKSKTLQENFDAEMAKSESLTTNLEVEKTNSKIHLANQLREEKRFQAQLREEEKKYKVMQENFDAGLKNFKSVRSQLEVELSNSKTLKENLDFTLKNLGQVRAENSRQLEEEKKKYKSLQEKCNAQLEKELSNQELENLDFTLRNLRQQLEDERKKYKSLQENCNAQLVKSKDYASKLWRETQRDTTILREELEEERKKFNDLQKNFDAEVLSDSKALTQNLTRQLGEEQKNLKVMKDSFINLRQECNKHKGAVNKLAGELVDQKKAYEKLKLQLPEKDVNFLLTEKDAIISNLNRQLSTRKEIRGSPQKIGAEENNNTAKKSKQESLLSMKENEDVDMEPPQVAVIPLNCNIQTKQLTGNKSTGNENENLKSSAIKPTKSQLKSTEIFEGTLDTIMLQCPFCESRFMSKNNVISHIGVRHKNRDPNVGFKKVFLDGTLVPNFEMSENSQLENQDSSEDMTNPLSPGGPPGDPGLRGNNLPLTSEKATSFEGPRGDVLPPLTPSSPPDKVTAEIAEEEVWVEEEINEKCRRCDEFFPNFESVQKHILEKHGGEHCKLCKKCIVGNFEDHLYNEHYKKKIQDAVPLKSKSCSACPNTSFQNYEEVVSHLVQFHKMCRKIYANQKLPKNAAKEPKNVKKDPKNDPTFYYQCLMCKSKTSPGSSIPEFDTSEELRAHLAVIHFKNFLKNQIKVSQQKNPNCPYTNCDFLAKEKTFVIEHFNILHKPEKLELSTFDDTVLLKKCFKCFLGPFETEDELLIHIGLHHNDLVDSWIKKLAVEKTLEPIRGKASKTDRQKKPLAIINLDQTIELDD